MKVILGTRRWSQVIVVAGFGTEVAAREAQARLEPDVRDLSHVESRGADYAIYITLGGADVSPVTREDVLAWFRS